MNIINKLKNKIKRYLIKYENESYVDHYGDVIHLLIPLNVLLLVNNKTLLIKDLILGMTFSEMLKKTTKIQRPSKSDNNSFFSGHVVLCSTAAFFLYYNNNERYKRSLYSKVLIILSMFVSFSRVYSKAHRIEDVITAILVGKNLSTVQ